MWSAFMNGSGVHGGGGAGYVPSQGWEFVPCSGMERADRGRGKSRSPARRISSPPAVFTHTYESRDGGDAGAQLEILRGPMWPGLEPLQQTQLQTQQQQQQTQQQLQTQQLQTQQHTRLKKKLEDLKKRHVEDKEEWMREKESLLREVADVQGGENRRILLELRSVLEEVQLEVKREEEKRSELQLQSSRDRCCWELEKAELRCRIAQLEARECAGFLGGGVGVQSAAAGSGSAAALRGAPRWEREEQHAAGMELRRRLELSERGWRREKEALLQRFDQERSAWESQLQDMQSKMETLYCDVRTKRDVKDGGDGVHGVGVHGVGVHGLTARSSSAGSSLLSDGEPAPAGPQFTRSKPDEFWSRGARRRDSDGGGVDAIEPDAIEPDAIEPDAIEPDAIEPDAIEPDASLGGAPHDAPLHPEEKPLWAEPSDRKKNTTALNAALKEIARVSEELCSYQDEIRKKSAEKRSRSASLSPSEGSESLSGRDETRLQVDEDDGPCDLGQIYEDLRALERETWINSSAPSSWRPAGGGPSRTWTADFTEEEEAEPSAGSLWEADGPPVPPRSSSWTLSSTASPDAELYIPESPVLTARACHSPGPAARACHSPGPAARACHSPSGALLDKKCSSSPSVVRKFEAMLQENEGKVLVDGAVAPGLAAPASSDSAGKSCCHARWSCDASRFTSKLSAYGTVQKSFSEVNIVAAARGAARGAALRPRSRLQVPAMLSELPLDVLLSALEAPPGLQGSRRNITLEQKTAEFNRTLFQAEMGRGVEQRGVEQPDGCSAGSQPVEIVRPGETTSPLSISNSRVLTPEVQSRRTGCGAEGQEIQSKRGIPPDGSSEPQTTTSTSQSHREVRPRGPAASGPPSRKVQPRAAAEVLSSEPVLLGQSADDSVFLEKENPRGPKPQAAGVQNQHRQQTPPRVSPVLPAPQPDPSCRPGPRAMSEHPWKALTLAAYPRPEGSRSNYGAVERILRSYESAARAQQNRSRPDGTDWSPDAGVDDNVAEPDAPDPDPLRHATQTRASGAVTELQLVEQKTVVTSSSSSSSSSSSAQKTFSRPARPARRRLPSRWAGRSPSSSSSPSATSSFSFHKHSSSFCYSHAFHMETVIL